MAVPWKNYGREDDRLIEHCFTVTGGCIPQGILSENMGKLLKLFPALNLDLLACEPQPRYNSSEAYSSITSALKAGFSMVDTALDYHNQDLVL